MEYVNILSRHGLGTPNEIINFNKAITANDNEGFVLSGSKWILSYLRSKIGDVPMLIDFSAIPSSFKNDRKLADFITIYDPSSIFVDVDCLDYSFNKAYGPLQKQNLGMFYHPDFFDCPRSHKYYFSKYDNTPIDKYDKETDSINKITLEEWKSINGDDCIYFKNKSFSISYSGYKKKSVEASKRNEDCQDRNNILLKFYNKYFLRDKSKDEKKGNLLAIPIIGYSGSEKKDNVLEGLGAIFVYFIKDSSDADALDTDSLANDLWFLGLQITYNSIFQIAMELAEKAKKEAIKSAKSAIMSRNMSHNIGSHVMSYLKQHLSSVTNIINDNVLAEMITSASDTTAIPSDKPLPFLVGMGHFLSYIQERQDFIATIATDYIPYFSTVNFKDFIYDELNPDKRFERHKDRKNLQPDNIMLGNIARSEGLGRKIQTTSKRSGQLSDIVLNFRDSKGHIFDGEPVVNSSNVIISGRNEASMALEAMRKLEVSLPGGVIGRQAIFSIVENIIRNAAKHGNWRSQGRLELTFDFVDKDAIEEYGHLIKRRYELEGLKKQRKLSEVEQAEYNSIINELEKRNLDAAPIETPSYLWPWRDKHLSLMEVLWLFYSQSLDAEELYFATITDNIVISDSAVDKLRKAIIEPYIDNESKMKEGNKGIKEIRISAAWLRGAKNEDEYFINPTDDKKPQTGKKAPLVYVRQHNGCLQYIICLQKPRNVAVVTQEPLSAKAIKALKEVNWRYYSPEDYIKERNKSYKFTICETLEIFNKIRPFSSSRVYYPDSDSLWKSIKNGLSESDGKMHEKEFYQSLVKEQSTIWIDDDKAKGGITAKIREDASYAKQEDEGYYKVNDVDVCVIDGCHSHVDYIYRKHHDTLDQFTTFMGVNPNGCLFVESITGDTSTDRLVRNEKYDFRWYYSHLHAMQKKVAIFDERLFSRIYGLEEADFTKGSVTDLDELKKKYCEIKPLSKRRINDCKTFDDLNRIVNEMNLPPIEVSRSDVYTKDYIALTYFQKGVCFYTLIKDSTEDSLAKSFGVYGLYYEGENCLMPQCDDKYSCRCERIATISWRNQALEVKFEKSSNKQIENKFDFISIHQGLLDKLYEAFDIKSSQEEMIQLTTTLCKRFRIFSSDNSYDWKLGFIPGLIVHSGRSKPAENDMPQMLPFIQYASIEHAVLDCKYSLIDLLENARYEQ